MEREQQPPALPPGEMGPGRLEAFSDAVMAVIITIMVLGLRPPDSADLAKAQSLVAPLLIYVLSFTFIGIYWNNHHHLLRATRRINGGVMWANLHLLFWLSLVPVVTAWVSAYPLNRPSSRPWPAAMYGAVAFMAGVAFFILTVTIRAANKDTRINVALGRSIKEFASMGLYALGLALALAFIQPLLAYGCYALVAIMWFIPDRRLARSAQTHREGQA